MKDNSSKLDKLMKLSIIAGILIVALSIASYFIIRPILIEKKLTNCLLKANENLDAVRNKKNDEREQGRVYLDTQAVFDEIQKRAEKKEKECFLKYPQK